MKLDVFDALGGSPEAVDVTEETSLAECRALALSLPLASCEQALEQGKVLRLCHDGCVLEAEDEECVSLSQLGVLEAPVVVVVAQKAPPMASARGHAETPTTAERSATSPEPPPAPAASAPALPTPPPARPLEPPADAACRICFGSAYENGAGKLIAPCRCAGSSQYVHVTCLNEWRAHSANPRSFYRCDQCHYEYNVQRTEWAAVLESDRVVRLVTAMLLVSATLPAAMVLGPLGVAQRFYRLVDFQPRLAHHAGATIAHLWRWEADYLFAGLLGVASLGFGISLRDAYIQHRHMQQQSWIVGLITAVASNDERIFRVFALLGYMHAIKVLYAHVQGFAKQMLTKFGTRIMEVPLG